jgi:hypothetical protein
MVMVEHLVTTTDAEIDAALDREKLLGDRPLALTVEYVADRALLIVGLSNGRRLVLPVEEVQGLGGAAPKQMRRYELLGGGTGIHFPELDLDLYVPALIEGVYGNQRWMAQLAGKVVKLRR